MAAVRNSINTMIEATTEKVVSARVTKAKVAIEQTVINEKRRITNFSMIMPQRRPTQWAQDSDDEHHTPTYTPTYAGNS